MKNVDSMAIAEKAMSRIKKGAFLTVKNGDELNTMAIGWATIGYVWQRPILMVAVRDSRHTFKLMEKSSDFTVSVTLPNMNEKVMYCGTKSGRNVDKFKEIALKTVDSKQVRSPIIDAAGIHFECKIVFKSAMDPKFMAKDFEKIYPEKDYHTLYFGEIVECYEIDAGD